MLRWQLTLFFLLIASIGGAAAALFLSRSASGVAGAECAPGRCGSSPRQMAALVVVPASSPQPWLVLRICGKESIGPEPAGSDDPECLIGRATAEIAAVLLSWTNAARGIGRISKADFLM